MACFGDMGFDSSEINGFCEDCGTSTVDGVAYGSCSYSPTVCDTCGYSPCDLSC